MFDNKLELEPVFSHDLINPSVKKLAKMFRDGFEVLYVYGPTGSGKSKAVELLLEENGILPYFLDKIPDTILGVQALSRYSDLLDKRPIAVVVDGIDRFSKKDMGRLLKGDWNYNKLIMIGYRWKRSGNPLQPLSKSKFVFKKIKLDAFKTDDVVNLLLRVAMKYKIPLTLEERNKIAEASNGDLRKAINTAKNYLLGGRKDLDVFLPHSEKTYHNRVKRIFGGDFNTALEEIEAFGWYYSVMILIENLAGKKDADELVEILMSIAMLKMQDRERYLALIACDMSRKYSKGKYTKWVFPKRRKKEELSEVVAKCGNIKKELYFL